MVPAGLKQDGAERGGHHFCMHLPVKSRREKRRKRDQGKPLPMQGKCDMEELRMHQDIPSPFSGLYAPVPDIGAYLRRIGYEGTPEVSLPCLTELMACHLSEVPFENLDVFHGRKEPSLDTEALFRKIVLERRGGYCFEINGLFQRLLTALGFPCWSAAARIVLGHSYLPPRAHQIVLAELEGRRYFCDVGYGGPVPALPIEIDYEKILSCPMARRYRFSLDGAETILSVERGGRFVPMLAFSEIPSDPVDFLPLNAYCAHSPMEPFLHKQMAWRRTPTGRRSIDGDILRVEQSGNVTETRLTSDEALAAALREHFGISYPGPLRRWR